MKYRIHYCSNDYQCDGILLISARIAVFFIYCTELVCICYVRFTLEVKISDSDHKTLFPLD